MIFMKITGSKVETFTQSMNMNVRDSKLFAKAWNNSDKTLVCGSTLYMVVENV